MSSGSEPEENGLVQDSFGAPLCVLYWSQPFQFQPLQPLAVPVALPYRHRRQEARPQAAKGERTRPNRGFRNPASQTGGQSCHRNKSKDVSRRQSLARASFAPRTLGDRTGARGADRDRDRSRRQAWAPQRPLRSSSLDRLARRRGEMGTGGRCVQHGVSLAAPPAPKAARRQGLPLRRYSVPETVMRKFSLQSGSLDSDSPPPKQANRRTEAQESKSSVPDRHTETEESKTRFHDHRTIHSVTVNTSVRTTDGSTREKSTQADGDLCEDCAKAARGCHSASTQTKFSAKANIMSQIDLRGAPAGGHPDSDPPSGERLCIHCGKKTSSNTPCTPKEVFYKRYEKAAKTSDATKSSEVPKSDVITKSCVATNSNISVSNEQCVVNESTSVRTECTTSRTTRDTSLLQKEEDFVIPPGDRATQAETVSVKVKNLSETESSVVQPNYRDHETRIQNTVNSDTRASQDNKILYSSNSEELKRASKKLDSKMTQKNSFSGLADKDNATDNTRNVTVSHKSNTRCTLQKAKSETFNVKSQIACKVSASTDTMLEKCNSQRDSYSSYDDGRPIDFMQKEFTRDKQTSTNTLGDDMTRKPQQVDRTTEPLSPAGRETSPEQLTTYVERTTGADIVDKEDDDYVSIPFSPLCSSPAMFRSRGQSSLSDSSTPESLKSTTINEQSTVDATSRKTSPESEGSVGSSLVIGRTPSPNESSSGDSSLGPSFNPLSPERARHPRFGERTMDDRTFGLHKSSSKNHPKTICGNKVHVVSETSSFIILDETRESKTATSDSNTYSSPGLRYASSSSRNTVRRQRETRKEAEFEIIQSNGISSGSSSEFEEEEDYDEEEDEDEEQQAFVDKFVKKVPEPSIPTKVEQEGDKASSDPHLEVAPDMFGVDEEGNVIFSEEGVTPCRPRKREAKGNGHIKLGESTSRVEKEKNAGPSNGKTAGNTEKPSNSEINNSNQTHRSGVHETVTSDHHSQEHTYFCGLKEYYSVTTEKVEKWGNESTEFVEKKTSHRIQHKRPQSGSREETDPSKIYTLSNRISIDNNNPILVTSEIVEIPPIQRSCICGSRSLPVMNGKNQCHQHLRQSETDFTLPYINLPQSQEPCRAQHETWNKVTQQTNSRKEEQQVRFDETAEQEESYNWSRRPQQEQQTVPQRQPEIPDLAPPVETPSEIKVAVLRYSALPRTMSMLVNMSSGEEDVSDNDSECLSCADSLESEQSPSSGNKHDDKPVRGHVSIPAEPPPKKPRRPRVQSPKVFFVSLSENEQTPEEEDLPVSARMPDRLRDRLLERHTLVKLQMAQKKRYLRSMCDSMKSTSPRRKVRVSVKRKTRDHLEGKKSTKVDELRSKPISELAPLKSHKRESKKEDLANNKSSEQQNDMHVKIVRIKKDVPPVVKVHKCHMDQDIKPAFKAKPYKLNHLSRNPDKSKVKETREVLTQTKPMKDVPHKRLQPLNQTKKNRSSKNNETSKVASVLQKNSRKDVKSTTHDEKTKDSNQDNFVSIEIKRKIEESDEEHKPLDVTWTKSDHEKSDPSFKQTTVHNLSSIGNIATKDEETNIQNKNMEITMKTTRKSKGSKHVHRGKDSKKIEQEKTQLSKKSRQKERKPKGEMNSNIQAQIVTSSLARNEKVQDSTEEGETTQVVIHSRELQQPKEMLDRGEEFEQKAAKETHQENATVVVCESKEPIDERQTDKLVNETTGQSSNNILCTIESNADNNSEITPDCNFDVNKSKVHTSVKTTVVTNDTPGQLNSTVAKFKDSSTLQSLLELGSNLENAEIRHRVIEIETIIERNKLLHNLIELETTIEKNKILKNSMNEGRAAIDDGDLSRKKMPPLPDRPHISPPLHMTSPLSESPRPGPSGLKTTVTTSPTPIPRRSSLIGPHRFHQKFEVIPEERNGSDETRTSSSFVDLNTPSAEICSSVTDEDQNEQSSRKGRAALHQNNEEVDLLTLSKGWINFYLLKETRDQDDSATEEVDQSSVTQTRADQRVQYTMQIRAVPEPPKAATCHITTQTSGLETPIPNSAPVSGRKSAASSLEELQIVVKETARSADGSEISTLPTHSASTSPMPKKISDSTTRVEFQNSPSPLSSSRSALNSPNKNPKASTNAVTSSMKITPENNSNTTNSSRAAASSKNVAASASSKSVNKTSSKAATFSSSKLAKTEATSHNISSSKTASKKYASTSNVGTNTQKVSESEVEVLRQESSRSEMKSTSSKSQEKTKRVVEKEDASTNTLCGPLAPQIPINQSTTLDTLEMGMADAFTMTRRDNHNSSGQPLGLANMDCVSQTLRNVRDAAAASSASAAGISSCTTTLSMSSCRRTVVTRRERHSTLQTARSKLDISDVLSTSSDSTEYMAPPGARQTQMSRDFDSPAGDESTSPTPSYWRQQAQNPRGTQRRPGGHRGRSRPGADPPGLYQHHVFPCTQASGPPPRDGVGWTVTVAGAGGQNGTGDLEMRLHFPAEENKKQGTQPEREQNYPRTRQRAHLSAAPGQPQRWSLTIRNQPPVHESEPPSGWSLSVVPGQSSDHDQDKTQRSDRSGPGPHEHTCTSRRPTRPLSLIWPRMHQDALCSHSAAPAPELSQMDPATASLTVTGSAIPRGQRGTMLRSRQQLVLNRL